ncbi:LysR substrate-binding domain-containing protein [Paracoccus sp. JM45]|uniref:LysR substrate-binding domain-containing protein n=1 Tax=Paracoccus sp. JM45 TaxID=2283626 RepID=UPI000E6CA11D|nr:LysR substrate-binding domain-containing protein [Paracoccus sp. JM45]RJE79695.1 LysR family transcriptional regulator [Paracoccus sp. JM45]
MELKWLEDFAALAATASFSRAAEQRNVTQSAFSRRIRQLETWLGADLVSRATIPAELTPEGVAFLSVAQDTIRTMSGARAAAQPRQAPDRPVLSIAALQTLTVTLMPQWLAQVDQAIPDVMTKLIPDRGGIEANLDSLITGEVDLLLTYSHPYVSMLLDPQKFDWITLAHDQVIPVMAPELACSGKGLTTDLAKASSNTDISAIPYLDYGPVSFFGSALERLFARHSLKRRVMHENSMCIGLRALALEGHGICWLPQSLIAQDLAEGRLVAASDDPIWLLDLDVRLYRCRTDNAHSRMPETLWNDLARVSLEPIP